MRSIGPLFGVVQHLESWIHTSRSHNAQSLQRAWELLQTRHHRFRVRQARPHNSAVAGESDSANLVVPSLVADGNSHQIDPAHLARQIIEQALTDQFDEPPFPDLAQLERQQLVDSPEFQRHFNFHQQLLGAKLAVSAAKLSSRMNANLTPFQTIDQHIAAHRALKRLTDPTADTHVRWAHQETRIYLHQELRRVGLDTDAVQVVFLNTANYAMYRQRIGDIQQIVYEPARQTELEKFDALMNADHQMAIVIERNTELIAMIFAAPLLNFPDERGVLNDPQFHNPQTFYVLDLTVLEAYRGGLGRVLKQAVTLYAACLGIEAIHGRNRDRYARSMWAINLSLGSYPTRFLIDDYSDDLPHRDCIYYRCPLTWEEPALNLSGNTLSPLRFLDLIDDWQQHSPPAAIGPWMSTSLTSLLADLACDQSALLELEQQLIDWFGTSHFQYAASSTLAGLSEIWIAEMQRLRPQGRRLIGWHCNTAPTRTLADLSQARPIEYLSLNETRTQPDWNKLQSYLDDPHTLGLWYEPLSSLELDRIAPEVLSELLRRCSLANIPAIADESKSAWFHYDINLFVPSQAPTFRPTISLFQPVVGIAACILFDPPDLTNTTTSSLKKPTGIATQAQPKLFAWQVAQYFTQKIATYSVQWRQQWHEFDHILRQLFEQDEVSDFRLNRGVGWFRTENELPWTKLFDRSPNGRYIICPGWGDIRCLELLTRYLHP